MVKSKKNAAANQRAIVPPLLAASLFNTSATAATTSSGKKKKGGAAAAALQATAANPMATVAASIAACAAAANITDPQVIMAMTRAAMQATVTSPGVVAGFPGFSPMLTPSYPAALYSPQVPTTSAAASFAKKKQPAKRTNSRQSSSTTDSTVDVESTGGSGIKLVIKRQSGNKFEVKQDEATSSVPSPASSSGGSNASGRPRREASRKVKFTSYTEESDDSPVRKQSRYTTADLDSDQYFDETDEPEKENSKSKLTIRQPSQFKSPAARKPQPLVAPPPQPFDLETDVVISCSHDRQQAILDNQPFVRVAHSKPFPIALVEDKTNVVATKAFLLLHLFQSYSAPCINCPLCSRFMSITEFSKHVHEEDEDDEEDAPDEEDHSDAAVDGDKKTVEYLDGGGAVKQKKKKKPEKTYKILPYRIQSSEKLTESEVEAWKLFGKRYSLFKQQRAEKLKESKTGAKPPPTTTDSTATSPAPTKKFTAAKPTIKFNDWDSTVTDEVATTTLYLASEDRLNSDLTITIQEQEASKKQQHQANGKTEAHVQPPPRKVAKPIDDLSLSEDEDEDMKVEEQHADEPVAEVQSATSPPSPPELEKDTRLPGPTLIERYFNLYDNLSKETLLYICDNQFTIIPNSYIMYINSKREKNLKNLKLAHNQYFQTEWLKLILNLESKLQRKQRFHLPKNDSNNNTTACRQIGTVLETG